jgi:hypothetical protein
MKKLLGLVFLMLILISATEFTSSKQQTNANSLEGTWELMNRFDFENGNVSDTLFNNNGYRQIKIYSKGKVMWTRHSPDDPSEWFGYGSYTNTENELEERLEFGSKTMMSIQDTVQVFKFELHLYKDSYSQITIAEDGMPINSENYRRID